MTPDATTEQINQAIVHQRASKNVHIRPKDLSDEEWAAHLKANGLTEMPPAMVSQLRKQYKAMKANQRLAAHHASVKVDNRKRNKAARAAKKRSR